ncbi:GDSL-like Lipase/Acylhydrolase [Aquisphaera giovannonii]|uniref:GDSL-like Lipase/Acylhydrolase n=1 Tax=Aquisphaera giovannonii TaxID=406548 RepID=A0A5B9WC44_9BACT|nr:SGNH/GDSL hydrolase family protein [Aquisphaera giovannonii]QEH37799.1 GDSL-like Lipase/Acylhydrolase [Aquisphaera giovannonii]
MPPTRPRTAPRRPGTPALLIPILLALAAAEAHAFDSPKPWPLRDGDRIVLVGDTLVERDQRYGYLETCLTLLNPELDLTFRNLGWSGDTVAGLSRAGFDPPEAGFKALVDQVKAARPTVLIVGYGMADSFDGEAGLPKFAAGMTRFLDAIDPEKSLRVVLLSPIRHEKLGPPLPDPAEHNRILELYGEVIRKSGGGRDARFVDLTAWFEPTGGPWKDTDDGIHLTEAGYLRLAEAVAFQLGQGRKNPWEVELEADGKPGRTSGVRVLGSKMTGAGIRAEIQDLALPAPSIARPSPEVASLRVRDLAPGRYSLRIDGREAFRGGAEELMAGVPLHLDRSADWDRVHALRRAIHEKNQLFFYRWRPQNQTYLFGFRRHEQGNNAVEIPRFDPLVAAKEKEIAGLKQPLTHVFEIVREGGAAR